MSADATIVADGAEAPSSKPHDLERILRVLQTDGYSIADSIKETMRLSGLPLGEAKRIVHSSEAWSDRREAHDAFHRDLLDGVATLIEGDPDRVLDQNERTGRR